MLEMDRSFFEGANMKKWLLIGLAGLAIGAYTKRYGMTCPFAKGREQAA
jgi:hypothetical protein